MSLRKEIDDKFLLIEKRIVDRENEARRWGDKQKRNAFFQFTKFQQAQKDSFALLEFVQFLKEENQELARQSVTTPAGQVLETTTHQHKMEQR